MPIDKGFISYTALLFEYLAIRSLQLQIYMPLVHLPICTKVGEVERVYLTTRTTDGGTHFPSSTNSSGQ